MSLLRPLHAAVRFRSKVRSTLGRAAFCSIAITLACVASRNASGDNHSEFQVVTVADGLKNPWSLAFLPGGDMLVTERDGSLRIVHDNKLEQAPIAGVPAAFAEGDGGLLGLALHPQFRDNALVYLCLSIGSPDANAASVIRARLVGRTLRDVKSVFTAVPFKKDSMHYGCRLMFAPDGKLLVTLGDGRYYPYQAQALDNDLGKVVRINDDGSIPADNPFQRRWKAQPEIYTYGHRNIQGIALNPLTGEVWTHEHGPKGGDEVNVLHSGANYGWPMVTYGIDYSGQVMSEKTEMPGMEQPFLYWVPSIAPSGMAFYTGTKFPEWKGDLFVGALAGRHLRRVHLLGNVAASQELLLADLKERIREVQDGPDGYLYVATDAENGRILRLEPR